MPWSNIDIKYRNNYNNSFISCDQINEINFIINLISEEYPGIKKKAIQKAIIDCCLHLEPPRAKDLFLNYVREKLRVD